MAIFSPRTFPEIIGTMEARVVATTPLTDINLGSVFTTMLEAAAQEDDEQYFQMLEIIRGYSLDTTTGVDLENRAAEYGLTKKLAQVATTSVTLGDKAITKISTTVYSGLPGVPAGSMFIHGSSQLNFPVSGSIIVGRDTAHVETVTYTSITNNVNYVTFNLSSGFAFDHGTDETIILSQGGNRTFNAGTVVSVPASDVSPKIDFTLDAAAIILDGEHQVTDVPVIADEAGSSANVPIGSISIFDSPPFATATVTNPARVTNGADEETDPELRDRIKATIQSLSRGTATSIINGIIGIISPSENKRVVSAALIEPTVPAEVVKLFIDDGTGFIPSYADIGFENVLPLATGGEKYLKVANVPVMKAFSVAQNLENYNLVGGETLFVEVGGRVETIFFDSSDFKVVGQATAQEVLTKINNTAQTFEARVTQNGKTLRIFARANTDEEIQVTGGTANPILGFPTDIHYTTNLYLTRNNITKLLTKDGITAAIETGNFAAYDFSSEKDLVVIIDGKTKNPQSIFFNPIDFATPALGSALETMKVINNQLQGGTAQQSSNDTKVTIDSNLQRSSGSKIRIVESFTHAYNTEGGPIVSRTTEFKTPGSNVTMFAANLNAIYLSIEDVPFQSVYVRLATPASASINPLFEYWDGAVWTAFQANDGTNGFQNSGHIYFRLPNNWGLGSFNGSPQSYFIRISRQNAAVITPPVEDVIKVCSANEELGFTEAEVVGANKDYTFNRFVGQIELVNPAIPGDSYTLGSFNTRASVVSPSGPFVLFGGEVLNIKVDGVPQTVTFQVGDFSNPGAALPQEVINRMALDLVGVAFVNISNAYIQVLTNTWVGGTIQVTGGSANSALNFPTDLRTSLTAHVPSIIAGSAQPYLFNPADDVTVVMDLNSANNFTIPCTRPSTLTSASSGTTMIDVSLNPIFPLASDIQGFDILYTQKYQRQIQDITYTSTNTNKAFMSVQYIGGGIAGAEVCTVVGVAITIQIQSGVSTATQVLAAFNAQPAATAIAAASITGVAGNTQISTVKLFLLPYRRTISTYNPGTGQIVLSSTLGFTPSAGDTYELTPKTALQIISFWSNKKISLITNNAELKAAAAGTKLQIASLNAGRTAAVQIAGGLGNNQLNFTTLVQLGNDAYRYFTGLAQLTQWTIDGITGSAIYQGIRAAGVQVEVAEPAEIPIKVQMTVTTGNGVSLSAIQSDIKSAVSAYIDTLPVGGDVILSSIIVAIKNVAGVADVQLQAPTSNIPIADNSLARINESDIVVG